jgi:glycosyltransferase involved in cell wall biosynthesis
MSQTQPFKIYATFNIYNEAQFIRQAIESVLWTDKIIVVDGAFPGFPGTEKLGCSNDGTLEIIHELQKQHPGKIDLTTFDTPTESSVKMNTYLKHMEHGDYFLRLNGDEIVESKIGKKILKKWIDFQIKLTNNLPLYQIAEYMVDDPHNIWYCPKLIRKTPMLKLTSRHLVLTNAFNPPYKLIDLKNGGFIQRHGKVEPNTANLLPALISIRHMKSQRNPERAKQNDEWLRYYYQHPKD